MKNLILWVVCIMSLIPTFVFGVQDDFGFWKNDSVIATKDVNVWSTDEIQREAAFLDIVKSVINWVLWISALIALILLIYGWVRMVLSWWNEEAYNEWFAILKSAAIGILLIGVAWFIASLIFWLINTFATTADWTDGRTSE
jgi:hypothetical protein